MSSKVKFISVDVEDPITTEIVFNNDGDQEGLSHPLINPVKDDEEFIPHDVVSHSIKNTFAGSQKVFADSGRISSKYHPTKPTNSPTVTIVLILNAMLGTGILNQPKVFAESGIIGGIVGYIIASFANWYGLVVLTAAGIEYGILDYSGLAHEAFGKLGENIIDLSIIVICLGAQIAFIIINGFTMAELLRSWGCPDNVCSDIPVTMIVVGVFMAPLCFQRHFGHYGLISIFSMAATVGVAILVWAFGPYQHVHNSVSSDYKLFDMEGLLSATGSIIFCISATYGNFPAYVSTEKEFQSLSSWNAITGIAVVIGSLIAGSMGLIGYISFEKETEGNILDNFPQHGYDFFKLLMVLHLITGYPINFVITRSSIVRFFSNSNYKSEELSEFVHSVVTIGLICLPTGIVILLMAIGYTSGAALTLILNLAGGIGGKIFLFFSFFLTFILTVFLL